MAASLQRLVISLLVVLTFTFIYFAQVTEAAGKGPRITHKVRQEVLSATVLWWSMRGR
jgi:peptidyl-prolyl cis-trans isomerase B (cyclophilin B)